MTIERGLVQTRNDSQLRDGGPAQWPGLYDLRAAGEALTDAISTRVRTANRLSHPEHQIDAGVAEAMLAVAQDAEDAARKMQHALYETIVPDRVREWAAGVPGLATGELFPRLLAAIGNPRLAVPYAWSEGGKRPEPAGDPYERTLRQLWQYCGCGDPDRIPRSDVLGHAPAREDLLAAGKRTQVRPLLYAWSSKLVMMATPVTKEGSAFFGRPRSQAAADCRYWKVFAEARTAAGDKVHARTCRNRKRPPMRPDGCGTVMHPEWGEPGSPWRPGHILAHAHRIAQKELLRDLWLAAG